MNGNDTDQLALEVEPRLDDPADYEPVDDEPETEPEQTTGSVTIISLDDVSTLEDLIGGEWVWDKHGPYWAPYCLEAHDVIGKAISNSLTQQRRCVEQNRDELESHVRLALVRRLTGELMQSFLKSPNRAGWLYRFVRGNCVDWVRQQSRETDNDERIADAVAGVLPAESVTEMRARKSTEHESLNFDTHQFENRKPNPRLIREPSTEDDNPRLVLLREHLELLPDDQRTFALNYVDSRHEERHEAKDRKRFQRLVAKLRKEMSSATSQSRRH